MGNYHLLCPEEKDNPLFQHFIKPLGIALKPISFHVNKNRSVTPLLLKAEITKINMA